MKKKIVDTILDLYSQYGRADYIGEPVSQIEHMGQAAEMAMKEGYDDEVVIAAFLHDIGHLCAAKAGSNTMSGFGVHNHEKLGADYLRGFGFPDRVTDLVEGHVQAKRYLCFKHPSYFEQLSEASRQTLTMQGGVMDQVEAENFEKNPLASVMIKMREWDDKAKKENLPIIDLQVMREKMNAVLPERGISFLSLFF
jgi:2-amino-1-hydroxyethylphosphonate dioxygenase (glycine-forming)